MSVLGYAVAAVVLAVFAVIAWSLLKGAVHKVETLIVNGVAGVLILLFLNVYLGWGMPLNLATVLISAVFGLPGVGTLVALHLFGML